MIDSVSQTAYHQQLIDTLRDWNVGGKACVFGTDLSENITSQFSFEDIVLISQREYDISNLYNLDGRWDTIFVIDILEHIPYPWAAVEEIRKHLKPHGIAVFITQLADELDAGPNDYWRFTPEGLRVLCAGYTTVCIGRDELIGKAATPRMWVAARTADTSPALASWLPPVQENASEGGPWQIDDFEETGGDQWVEKRVCDYLISTFKPQTGLDIGCGAGLFVSYLNHRSVDTWGVEAADLRSLFPLPEKFIQHDLRIPLDLQRQFDLVLCLEVAEHIDAAFEQVLFETIRRHSRQYLLFSAATLGQEGHGHINLHPEEYWFTRLRELGYHLLVDATNICRALCVHSWYAKNISFWELSSESLVEKHDILPALTDQPDSYIRRIEEDYLQQRAYINTLQQKHTELRISWEEQRQRILASEQLHADLTVSWEKQQQYISGLQEQYKQLLEAWKQQQEQSVQLQSQYKQLLEAWDQQQEHINVLETHTAALQAHAAEIEQYDTELKASWRQQQQHIDDLEHRHATLLESWENQRQYIDGLEQRYVKLLEEWNKQHQYIEDLSQRHTKLIEEWHKQQAYINQELYKQ